ncbi:hypothetical protein BC830DRAFT_911025 [Chytriomyces sp. MP71]|nr:hypothetical protein BC830DRAFT_911025 [Chytriomyces sp. MP71]
MFCFRLVLKLVAPALRLLKQQELDQLRETNDTIEQNWTDRQTDTEAHKIVEESTAFLTQRGGSYQSMSRGMLVSLQALRPLMTKLAGAIITATQLWSFGFQRMMFFEQRNWVNMAALERVQQILAIEINLPIGRRLFRNYFGGGRPAKDGEHLRYSVYLTYCKTGCRDLS